MISGIYIIYNTVTNKSYIGSAINFKGRFKLHKGELKRNRHHSIHLQRAYDKHGLDNFQFLIVEYCEPIKEVLEEREQWWLDLSKGNNYNIRLLANSNVGIKRSDLTRERMSKVRKGVLKSAEARKNMSIAQYKRTANRKNGKNNGQCLRNFEKWPCVEGSRCRCDICRKTRYAKT